MATRMKTRRYYALRITKRIAQHPNNAGHRGKAMLRGVGWQVYKRISSRPMNRRVFETMTLRCYTDSNSASNFMYFGDMHEFDEMTFAARYLRPGDGFIDAGANIGSYTLLAASRCGKDARIDAFEPVPVLRKRLEENVRINGLSGVTVHAAALGHEPGNVEFIVDWDVSNRIMTPADEGRTSVSVPVARLDDALPETARYALGKLDVEGAELMALAGANRHLSEANPPVWLIEAFDSQLRKLGATRAEVLRDLATAGYVVGLYNARTGVFRWGQAGEASFIAVHQSARGEVERRVRDAPSPSARAPV